VEVLALSTNPELRFDGPTDASRNVALADGAGAGMDSPFMPFFAKGLAKRVFRAARFEYPYTASKRVAGKQKPPDREPVLRQPGLDATNWRAGLAIRFGVILRKVWGGRRTWAGARAQSVLMSVWRTCWQQGRSALDFLSQLLRGTPVALALPL
jgi:predicted alpha/beta-hydrolase family hydrolase